VGQYQKIISIPLKRAGKPLMGYLEVKEVKSILDAIDRETASGQRDYVLLKFLYNTGARVQEACDLSVSAFQLQEPYWVIITGKGRKMRLVPLWPETASLLKTYLTNRAILDKPDAKVFVNSRGESLTRFGIRYIIQTRITRAASQCPSLAAKKISPHTFRHTTAMHLLQSGVDLTVIKSWLGHVDLSTTHIYVEIDLEMKRKALSLCHPAEKSKELQQLIKQNHDVISWLKSV
jgi:site-specific recombinase XerD